LLEIWKIELCRVIYGKGRWNESVTVFQYDSRIIYEINLEACEHPEYREGLEKGLENVKELLANSVQKRAFRFGRRGDLIVSRPSSFRILTLT
jgi:hypothetical protein